LVKRAVAGDKFILELLLGIHLGQCLHPGHGTGCEELGGYQILGGRVDDVGQWRWETTWW
jgi:hypothetical protein